MRKQKYYKYADDKENFNVEESLDAKENIFKNHLEEEIIIKPDNVRKIASRARKILKEKMIEMGYGR